MTANPHEVELTFRLVICLGTAAEKETGKLDSLLNARKT